MRCVVLTTVLLLRCLPGHTQPSMECERYQVKGNLKTERSVHRFEMDKSRSTIRYKLAAGQVWLLQSPAALSVSWSSPDGLRAVAMLVDSQHPEQRLLGPAYVVDLDFGRLRLRMESFGGAMDLDEVVDNPWKFECRRLN